MASWVARRGGCSLWRWSGAAGARRCSNRAGAGDGAVGGADTDLPARDELLDTFGRTHDYLRISLTEKCNLRCTYCMPSDGVALTPRERLLSGDELARLVRVFASLGVTKLRLTGGEPTLRRDLEDVIRDLRAVPGISRLAMTSNGVALSRRLPALARAGLDSLNLSLDTLRAPRYLELARRPALPHALAAMRTALAIGLPLKLNVVLMRGVNDDELPDFVSLAREHALDVRFIEFMPFAGNEWGRDRLVPHKEALAAALRACPGLRPEPPRANDTAVVYRADGHAGRVGFISSMTRPFCGSCNRLRLTADGNLKVCLFGAAELSLRDAVRAGADDRELERLVRAALRDKRERHAGMTKLAAAPARPMVLIGG